MAATPCLVTEGNQCGERAVSTASTAVWRFPSVLFLKPTGSQAAFIGPEFAANTTNRYGYVIRFTAGTVAATAPASCNGLAKGKTVGTFFVAADLLQATNSLISRYFGVNASGVIFQSTKRVPVTQTGVPPAPAKPIG